MHRRLCTTLHSTCTYIHSYIYLQISNQIWNTYSGTVYDSINILLQTTGNPQLSQSPASSKLPQLPFEHLLRCHLEVETWRDIFRFLQKTYLKKWSKDINIAEAWGDHHVRIFDVWCCRFNQSFMPEFQMWDSISVTIHWPKEAWPYG